MFSKLIVDDDHDSKLASEDNINFCEENVKVILEKKYWLILKAHAIILNKHWF